jgi:exosortase H (IPTLxxWG-CTERM-specific)
MKSTGVKSEDVGRRRMQRFLVLFPISLLVGFGVLKTPFVQATLAGFTRGIVIVTAGAIRLFGGLAAARGDILQNPANGFAVQVMDGCNGVNAIILLWAAVLTFPAPWLHKVKGLLAGALALQLINLVRIVTLFYLGQWNTGWFDFAHLYLWEGLIMLDTLAIFWFWVRFMPFRPHETTT